ncbi:hypothetical protein CHUAL_009539 [Chamberlinius hualienensis]
MPFLRNLRVLSVKFKSLSSFINPGGYRFHSKSPLLPFEVNTAVSKDVILFKYENERYFRYLHFFAFSQLAFWTYLSEFAYSSLQHIGSEEAERKIRDSMPTEETAKTLQLAWWRKINFGENKYRNGITLLFFSLGSGIFGAITLLSRRTVKYLSVLKGGNSVKLQTYSPLWWPSRPIVAPVEHFSCQTSRSSASASSLPVRIKGFQMFFLLDKSGTFTNSKLFDATAGLKRTWR